MAIPKDPTIWMPNEKARAFFADLDDWLRATGTHYKCLAAAAGTTTNAKGSVIRHGCSMRIDVADKLIAAKNAHPNGIAPPAKKKPTGRPIGVRVIDPPTAETIDVDELQARRDAVRLEREQRALFHLSQEKPGLSGKRFSMRPVWEQVA